MNVIDCRNCYRAVCAVGQVIRAHSADVTEHDVDSRVGVVCVQCTGFPHLLESPGFFSGFCRPWIILENQFGPGKFQKLKLKVLGSTGK